MSRGNVFKLSGNLALGTTPDTYSTSELQSIKSSLRLLKARQSQQKRSEHNIDINGNYGVSYSSNTGQRSQLKPRNQNPKEYNYFQNNAKNHVPGYENEYNYNEQPVGRMNSKASMYENGNRERNGNYSSMPKNNNQYNYQGARNNNNEYGQGLRNNINNNNDYSQGSRNNNYGGYSNSNNNNSYDMPKEQPSARNPIKTKTQQPNYNDQDYYNSRPINNNNNLKNYQQPRANNQKTRPPLRKQHLNQQASYGSIQNDHEQKSLKQVNRQTKQQIVQYDPATFVECSVGCGRKFNPDSISKHQNICYKVFQKKRKQFNAQQQRVLDQTHNKILKKAIVEEKRQQTKKPNAKQSGKNDQKMSKWKAQSLAFRAMLKNNKGGQVSAEEQRQLDEIKSVGMIKCPTCGRSFNETAGPKHIAFCQAQNKKNKMKR